MELELKRSKDDFITELAFNIEVISVIYIKYKVEGSLNTPRSILNFLVEIAIMQLNL